MDYLNSTKFCAKFDHQVCWYMNKRQQAREHLVLKRYSLNSKRLRILNNVVNLFGIFRFFTIHAQVGLILEV